MKHYESFEELLEAIEASIANLELLANKNPAEEQLLISLKDLLQEYYDE